ncbi:MAG: hypothetical protein LBU81_00260 [Methanosarcinales archaeon]|nr:hypothetical protein [Methanosarcinales archaeon]
MKKSNIIIIFVLLFSLTVFVTMLSWGPWGPYTDEELRNSARMSDASLYSLLEGVDTNLLFTKEELNQSAVFNTHNNEPAYSDNYLTKTYTWRFSGHTFTTTLQIPEGHYEYYRNESHTRNYNTYALTSYDRQILNSMIEGFKQQGELYGFSKDQNAMNIIAFIQSLPYTNDNVTTGYDEYPRYPIETLIDGGDCEDTSILAVAILSELGYGTILISPPNHMALGIMGSENISGTYYEYNGSRYYYVETTDVGWDVGVLPSDFVGKKVNLYPISKKSGMNIELENKPRLIGSDLFYTYYEMRFFIENTGPAVANNVSVFLVAESEPFNTSRYIVSSIRNGTGVSDKLWNESRNTLQDYKMIEIGQMSVDSSSGKVNLRVPHNEFTQFTVFVFGHNFLPIIKSTEIFQVSNTDLNATMNLERLNRFDLRYAYYKVHCNIINDGDAPALNVYINITAETVPFDNTVIWTPEHNIYIGPVLKNSTGGAEAIIKVPKGESIKITCEVYDSRESFEPFEISSYTTS